MDTLTQRERFKLMAKIHLCENKDTEVALAKLFRRHKITGWRRHIQIRDRAVAAVYDRRCLKAATPGAHRAPLQNNFACGRISFFKNLSSRSLWMVVSGTVAPSMQRSQKVITRSGKRNCQQQSA